VIPVREAMVRNEKITAMILKYVIALSIGAAMDVRTVRISKIPYAYVKTEVNPTALTPLKNFHRFGNLM
jgi:hypothetical protein